MIQENRVIPENEPHELDPEEDKKELNIRDYNSYLSKMSPINCKITMDSIRSGSMALVTFYCKTRIFPGGKADFTDKKARAIADRVKKGADLSSLPGTHTAYWLIAWHQCCVARGMWQKPHRLTAGPKNAQAAEVKNMSMGPDGMENQ